MTRARGRPAGDQTMPTRENMLAVALQHLESGGIEGFTMRALAKRLGVNPMTIHHHFGSRDGLIKALADQVYVAVAVPDTAKGLDGIEALLRSYYASVVMHPELTLLIFNGPEVFPLQAQRITDDIARLLAGAGLTQSKATLWLGILVDITHGAAIATAMAVRDDSRGSTSNASTYYAEALAELLTSIEAGQ
jgi:AcrR family transcriptional regulator